MTDKKYCHDVSNMIDLYIHDELDSYGKEMIEEHISVCGECRLRLDSEFSVVESLKRLGDDTPDIASAVMKRIIDNKITVAKPKRKFPFAPSLIPAAVAVVAVTLFSRTNIMKTVENNFDSSDVIIESSDVGAGYSGAEMKSAAFTLGGTEEAETDGVFSAAGSAVQSAYEDNGAGVNMEIPGDVEIAIPELRSFASLESAPEESGEVNYIENEIQDMTNEYDAELFNTVKGQLDPSDEEKKDEINTLIVLNGENEALLAELLQNIEYEEVNGIIMTDISAFQQFRQNATENNFDDFKIYQENTNSTVLAFTFTFEE